MRMTRKIRRAWLRGKPEWAKCYLLKQRMRKQAKVISYVEKKNRLHNYSRYLVAGVMLACLGIGQGVASASEITASAGVQNNVVKNGNVYNIYNQTVKNGNALNKFDKFNLSSTDIANLQLGAATVNGVNYSGADRQINLVTDKVVLNGVLNSFKNGQIGGDVYFFSDKGIAVGATGVVNVGSLTLGTIKSAGEVIFYNWDPYENKSAIDKAKFMAGNGSVSIDGTINSIGDVIIGAKQVTVGTKGSINTGASFENNGVPDTAWTTATDYRSNFMNLNGVDKATSATKTSSGDVVLFGASAVNFIGEAYTAGGDFKAVSDSVISFIGTSSSDNDKATVITNGGDVSLSVQRDERANVKIDLTNAKIDAEDKNDSTDNNGNVDVVASTIAETFSWAMEGNKAEINIDSSEIKGDNVNIAAMATISGEVAEYDKDVQFTDEEIEENWKDAFGKHDDGVLDLIHDTIGFDIQNLRTLASATVVKVNSAITVKDSKIDAIGGTKAGTDSDKEVTHGNLNMLTVGNSRITTSGLGFFNFSVVVGMSDVESKLTITNSDLYAKNHINLAAKGNNNVELTYLDLSLADMVPKFKEVGVASAGFNWAELNSYIAVTIDEASTLKAENNVGISAESIRSLVSTTVAGGDTDKIGVVASVAIANTKAEAKVEGEIYAGGDITVSALNSIEEDEDGFYTPDTSTAESMSGDTFLGKPVVNAVKHGINGLAQKIFSKTAFDLNGVPGKGKDWGVNAATAVLVSENEAIASVTGKVRGFENGVASDNVGANKLEVKAKNISRTSMAAQAYQNKLTDLSGNTINTKDTGISLTVNAGFQDNTAKAYIGGDIKVENAIDVEAVTELPWKVPFENTSLSGILGTAFSVLTNRNQGLPKLVDSWAQASAITNKVGGAGSVGVVEYASTAEAYIDKNAIVTSGGTIDVKALTDVTTINFSGNITSPITMLPVALWQGVGNLFKRDVWGASAEDVAIGGAALAVRQKNVAKAYIADSDIDGTGIKGSVTASNVNVEASNEGVNLGMLASGGTSETVAIDGTVGVFRVENEADAHIGQAKVIASEDVTVTAKDKSHIINLAGVVAASSGSASIGATVAYNHIDRDTSAYINGNVTAGEKISVDALNDGLIVATSLAGSVAYNKIDNGNAASSQGARAHNEVLQADGTYAIEMEDLSETGSFLDDVDSLLNDGGSELFGDNDIDVDTGENTISNVADQDQGAGAGKGKNAFAVSANVGVNRVLDDATAYVAPSANIKENTPINPILNADFVRVTSKNDSEIVAANATASINTTTGKASTGIAGTFMYNSITSSNDAFVNDATITVGGNTEESVDEALTITAENLEKIINVSLSGSIAPKGNGIVGQVGVNRIANDTHAYIEDSVIRANEKTTVKADDRAEIQSYTGAISVTGGAVGIGAAIGVQDIDTNTSAYIGGKYDAASQKVVGGTELTGVGDNTKGGNVDVLADENSKIVSIVATAGVGLNTAMVVEASVSANDVDTSTKAYIDNDKNIKAAAINVAARNLANSTIGVGQIGVGKNAIGVASAILLSNNDVEAYIKGDDSDNETKNKIEASSIDVTATNIYNGSAKDIPKEKSEENDYVLTDEDYKEYTTAKTVAVGGAVGYNAVAGAGSVTVNIINNNTKAHLDQGIYETTGAISVNAQSTAHMFGLAGGISVAKGVGVGAAVDTQMLDAFTEAYIADNVSINKAGNITVNAESFEKITSVAVMAAGGQYFAGAAVANAHEIDVDTIAYIGSDNAADTAKTTLVNVGDVSVTAKDDVDLAANAGGASLNISGSGGASGSLGAAVEVLNKNVKASVGKVNINNDNSLKVIAQNTGELITTANGIALAAAIYGGGVTGSASESIVAYSTDAHIASDATVTVADDIIVDADSSFTHVGEAAAVGAGSVAGIGLSNDTTVFTATTDAYIGDSEIIANNKINVANKPDGVSVTADSLVDITSAVAAGAAGAGAMTGGVGVNVINTSTKAYIGASAEITSNYTSSDGGVVVAAQDITKIAGGSGGLTVTGGGVGAAVNVNDITKQTLAYVGSDAVIKSAGVTTISAHSIEEIYNVGIQATGGAFGGLAGAVGVHNVDVITKAYADTGADIIDADNSDTISGGNVKIEAKHEVGISSTVVGATAGGGVVGAAVDVANVISQTNAFVGNNATVKTAGNVDVLASELDKDITYKVKNEDGTEKTETAHMGSHTAAGSVGGLTVSGSVSVYSFGSGMSADDARLLNTNTNGDQHTDENGKNMTFDDWVNQFSNQSYTLKAVTEYKGNEVAYSIGNALENRTISTTVTSKPNNNSTGSTAGGEGTLAKVGSGAEVYANNINVSADSNIEMNSNVGSGVAGIIAAGASVGVVNNNSKISAIIDGSANVTATNDVDVNANSMSKLNGLAVAPGVGFIVGNAAAMDLNSNTKVTTSVADNAVLNGENITIQAFNTPVLNARSTGASVGVYSVGVVTALVDSYDDAIVNVGNNVILDADEKIEVKAENKKYVPQGTIKAGDPKYNFYVKAEAGSGGVVTGSVIVSHINAYNDTSVTIGNLGAISAKQLEVLAKHEDSLNYEILSAGAAGVSGTGSDHRVNIDSDVAVNIANAITQTVAEDDSETPNTKAQITTTENTIIRAENSTIKDWLNATSDNAVGSEDYNALSAGASLAGGSGIVNITEITHNTDVNLGDVIVKANAAALTSTEQAEGITLADKNAIAIDAYSYVKSKDYQYIGTGSVIEAAEIDDDNKVNANTNVNIGAGTEFYAGDVARAKVGNVLSENLDGSIEDTYVYTDDPTGRGTFAPENVGAGKISVGVRNDADMYSKTYVNTWGGVGVVGATNDVVFDGSANVNFAGKAETANGDVRLAAGRDSSGNASVINVTADGTLLNGTVIPVSHTKNPTANVDSEAKLVVGASANVKSDADIYLQSNAGTITALGTGEVHDWAHAVAEFFNSSSWKTGKSSVKKSADVEVNGLVETGIHRNQGILITGTNDNGNWKTLVKRTYGIGYGYTPDVAVASKLSARLAELRDLRAAYIADSAAVAAYDAEIAFIEAKMVEQGLGYYVEAPNGERTFVEYDLGTTSELANAETLHNELEAVLTQYEQDKVTINARIGSCNDIINDEKTKYDNAKKVVDDAVATAGNISFEDYVTANSDSESVVAYNTALTNYDNALDSYNDTYGTTYTVENADLNNEVAALNEAVRAMTGLQQYENELETQISATEAFESVGKEIGGKFYRNVDNGEVNSFTVNSSGEYEFVFVDETSPAYDSNKTLLHFETYGLTTDQVTLSNISAKLGDIIVEGDNLYTQGTGQLKANNDAVINIINSSPNNLIVNNVKILGGNNHASKIYAAADITFNGNLINETGDIQKYNKDSTKNVSFASIVTKDINDGDKPQINIKSTFNPSHYPISTTTSNNVVANTDSSTSANTSATSGYYYAAPSLTIYKDATIYNPKGSVTIDSDYGDIYNDGTINAGTISMVADNGDYIESDSNQIRNIGGNPDEIYNGSKEIGVGVIANGNIFISARYVNINSTIQSGKADWTLEIPNNYRLYYKDAQGTHYVTVTDIAGWTDDEKSSRTVLIENATGSAADNLYYDVKSERFVIDGLEVHGGRIDIVGTVLNTAANDSNGNNAGKIVVLDGYGDIRITNNSNIDLELKNVNSGEGVEGVITITDLNRETGTVTRKTTYTRNGGSVNVSVVDGNGTAVDTSNMDVSKYKPADNLYYIWQTGVDTSTVTEYHYSDSKALIWWDDGKNEDTKPDVEVVSVTSGVEYHIEQGTLISNVAKLNPANTTVNTASDTDYHDEYNYTVVTSTEKFDERNTEKRLWYTLWIVKEFDHWYKEKVGTTKITQHSLVANHDIGIQFIGAEDGGKLTVTGSSADVILNGMISNVSGNTSITGENIVQGTDGYIKTRDLLLNATNNVGVIDKPIQTDADYLSGSATNGMFAVEVLHGGVRLGNNIPSDVTTTDATTTPVTNKVGVQAGTTAYIKAAGDITQLNGTTVVAQRVELDSQTGGIWGSNVDGSVIALNIDVSTPENGVKNAAYGLKAEAADGIYINNVRNDDETNGDLYIDSVISHTGDVVLTTKGSFIDNNDSDIFDETAADKLLRWGHGQILADVESTAKLQKEMLITKAQNKYNRYQLLSKMANENDEIVLSDLEIDAIKRTLYEQDRKEKTNKYINNDEAVTEFINEHIANLQQEYDAFLSENAHAWTDTALKTYIASIESKFSEGITVNDNGVNSYNSTLFAKADLETVSHNFASNGGVEFLTADEKAEILVGSARSKEEMLVTNGPGMLKEVTDTNLVIKTVPNVKGKNVTLTNVDANEDVAAIGSASKISGTINPAEIVGILEEAESKWTTDDKRKIEFYEAYLAAERGDVVTNSDGSMTITVAKPIVVEAAGKVNAVAKSDVLLASESDVAVDEITSGGEVRLKANGNVIGSIDDDGNATTSKGTITATKRVILESAQGSITGIKLVEASDSAANEKHELIARAAEDITISKAGNLVVDTVFSANGTVKLNVTGENDNLNDITALYTGNGAELNISGVNIELVGVDNLGEAGQYIGLKGRVGEEASDSKITANVNGNVYINTYGYINAPEISGQSISAVNFAEIIGGELEATNGSVDLVNNGSIIGTSLISANAVTYEANAGSVTQDAVITAEETVTYKANAGTEKQPVVTQGVVVTAEKAVDIDALSDVGFATISTDENVDINSDNGASVSVEQVDAQSLEAVVARDINIGTADIAGKADLRAGNDISADVIEAQDLAVEAGNDFAGQQIVGHNIGIIAGNDITVSSKDEVNSLAGVTTADPSPVNGTDPSAGILTGEVRTDYTSYADDKGSATLVGTGSINLEAGEAVAIDTLVTNDNVAQIEANMVGIDDAQNMGDGATQISIEGYKDDAAYYVGIGTSDNNPLHIIDSTMENLSMNAIDNAGLYNTIISGDATINAGKVQVNITDNKNNPYSIKVGELSISDSDITTSEYFAYVLDGVTVNGSHRTPTHLGYAEDSLYAAQYAGKDGDDDESKDKKETNADIDFAEVAHHEKYEKI